MSRSDAIRLSPLDRARLTAYIEADLSTYRAAGAAELADYCEDLPDLIREGAFDQAPVRSTHKETQHPPPAPSRDGRCRAGQRWFLEKLEPTLSRRDQ